MNYNDALAWLYSTQGTGIKLGLENIRQLLNVLGISSQRQRFIHVAGTNGKGSVCAMLDAICREAGLTTGLFTSPHLVSYRERIRLNGETIPEDYVASALTGIREKVQTMEAHPTFFEISTALGLAWYEQKGAEVVVLETGLGGRLDSTNIVTPVVSVLTPISFDHKHWLGNTLREIATEKAGIIKPGVPVVSAPQPPEAVEVFRQTAERLGCSLEFVESPVEHEVALAGSHQKINAAVAVAALKAAQLNVSDDAIRGGLKKVIWPGRFQRVGRHTVLDGAHNPSAATRLVETWREVYREEKPTILLGVLKDKEVAEIVEALAALAAEFVLTPVNSARSATADELAAAVQKTVVPFTIAQSAEQALPLAWKKGRKVLVTGSLFLVGETLALLGGGEAEASMQ